MAGMLGVSVSHRQGEHDLGTRFAMSPGQNLSPETSPMTHFEPESKSKFSRLRQLLFITIFVPV